MPLSGIQPDFGLGLACKRRLEGSAVDICELDESRMWSGTRGRRGQSHRGGSAHRSSDPEGTGGELVVSVIVRESGLWQCGERRGVVVGDWLLVGVEQIGCDDVHWRFRRTG